MPAWAMPIWYQQPSWWQLIEAALPSVALIWSSIVVSVICIGTFHILRSFLSAPSKPATSSLPSSDLPHVTLIRPVDGLEPLLWECLASSFAQAYPRSKLSICFCVSSKEDPSYLTLEKLVAEHPEHDSHIYIEREDPNLYGPNGNVSHLGPNPKIRNMSRAYREAKGEVIWIVDCNVWISASVCGLMVDRLCGFGKDKRKFKFVHELPLAVDISTRKTPSSSSAIRPKSPSASCPPACSSSPPSSAGAVLDELFLSTAHAKFYTAISAVAIAPCIVGKSNMFRKSHLDLLTPPVRPERSAGIDFFSDNICEDHLIGDLLWKTDVPEKVRKEAMQEGRSASVMAVDGQKRWGNHAILTCPPCIQPLSQHSLGAYAARRARWLRVRKFTVPVATLVEPGTESLLACACIAYALTSVACVRELLDLKQSWGGFAYVFCIAMVAWMALDYGVWMTLQSWKDEEGVKDRVFGGSKERKNFWRWLKAWAGREGLAFPVWAWAVLGGTTVVWRGRRFWVGMDMRVHAVDGDKQVEEGKKER